MPNPYTPEEASAFARYFAAGGKVTKLPPCCLQLEGAVPREDFNSLRFHQNGFNARRDGKSGETDSAKERSGRLKADQVRRNQCERYNAKRSAAAVQKFPAIVELLEQGVKRKDIEKRLKVGKDTVRRAIAWAREQREAA